MENERAEGVELLAALTARLASTANLDEIVDTVLGEIVNLGFGAVWMAVLDEPTGNLLTLKEVIDGVDTTHEMPAIFMLDMRQPIGHGFRERRMINVADPDTLFIIDDDTVPVPPDRLALPRVIYQHMRGHPFACGPLLGSRGQPVGALGLSSFRGRQPIPDSVFREGMLRAFMDHLGIAMERALHITRLERINRDLVRAQAAINNDARIKAVGELAAAVAHDLNNLSGVASMAVSVGLRSPEAAFETLPRIERATRAIGDLVARLQRVARPARGPDASTDLYEVVDDIVTMVDPILREHSIQLELELPRVPRVRVDSTTIHQVILNLILNAQDALATNAPDDRRLRIRLRDDDGVVRLIVSDNGTGIPEEILPQLFQPFVTTKGEGHVGLGLAAAHASLEHFGGHIEGRNSTGGGAVFEVTLRAATGQLRVPKISPPPPLADKRQARILAVDDDDDILCVITAYLEPLGHVIVTANTGERALELAAREPFDVILCDVGMPRRSGLDVCVALRESGYRGKLILMTGWDAEAIKRDWRAAKSDSVLRKPFVGGELLAVIAASLVS